MNQVTTGTPVQSSPPLPKEHRLRNIFLWLGSIILGIILGSALLWPYLDSWVRNELRIGLISVLALLAIGTFAAVLQYRRHQTLRNAIVLFLLIALTVANATTMGIHFFIYGMPGPSFVIDRSAKNDRQRILLERAEAMPCPSQERIAEVRRQNKGIFSINGLICYTGTSAIAKVETEKQLEKDHPSSNDYIPYAEYNARVGTGFPGDLPIPTRVTDGIDQPADYWGPVGENMTEASCRAARGAGASVVQMIFRSNGILTEHRVYFNAEDQPVCQALYESEYVYY